MRGKKRERKGKVSRREFLKAGVAGLGMAAMGGLTEKAFGAPAVIKGTKLTTLQGTYFIAPGQELYKKQAQEWGEANGVQMSADFLNWPDLQPKIAAAIQGGGVDIVELWPGWNYLYQKNLVDLTDMALEFGKRGGGFEKYVNSASVKGRYLGILILVLAVAAGLVTATVSASWVHSRQTAFHRWFLANILLFNLLILLGLVFHLTRIQLPGTYWPFGEPSFSSS